MIPDSILRWLSAVETCKHPAVDSGLLLAMIWQESEGNPWAWNPEPRYPWLWNVRTAKPYRAPSAAALANMSPPAGWPCLAGDPDNEWWGQMASWGLLQPMGAVARERGFTGGYLPELCDPQINIRYASAHLWAYGYLGGSNSMAQALTRYNGSSIYADEVTQKLAIVQTELSK